MPLVSGAVLVSPLVMLLVLSCCHQHPTSGLCCEHGEGPPATWMKTLRKCFVKKNPFPPIGGVIHPPLLFSLYTVVFRSLASLAGFRGLTCTVARRGLLGTDPHWNHADSSPTPRPTPIVHPPCVPHSAPPVVP